MNLKLLYISLFLSSLIFAQDYSGQWTGYYSYLNITGIAHNDTNILASAENAIFKYNPNTQENSNTSTIQGLTGETISYYYHSTIYETSVIGYDNGIIEIVTPEKVITVVDIFNKQNIPPNIKKINHVYELNGLAYISCDFGISTYSLENLEFEDSYFIGNAGGQISVKQTTIKDQYIYAATTEGIKRAEHANSNIIDFSLWETLATPSLNWKSIVTFNNSIYAIDSANTLHYNYNGTTFDNNVNITNPTIDHRISNDKMLITSATTTDVYESPFTNTLTINNPPEYESDFTVATILNNNLFIGTKGDGVLNYNLSDGTLVQDIKPDGPLENSTFAITAIKDEVWVVYGAHTSLGGPSPRIKKGFSHFKNNSWTNTNYDPAFEAANLVSISVNPFNTNQVFMGSFWDGILEVNNDTPTVLYNETNTDLELWNGWILAQKSTFDSDGKLWFTTVRVDDPLKVYNPQDGSLNSFSFSSLFSNPGGDEINYSDIEIDQNNVKWLGTTLNGIIGFSENNGTTMIKNLSSDNGNLPSFVVKAIAIDNDNNLWIGTNGGLRVLYNTSGFFTTANPQAESIIILEEGIPRELMFGQTITDIKVDGANNKWISTFDAGAFYFSSDGQKTIYHFTKDNSPLPSNGITDMAIDNTTGVVYFATEKGIVSFNATATTSADDLDNVIIQPNPVRPSYIGNVIIKGLVDQANIKITDISGNLVDEGTVQGGTYEWNRTAFGKHKVASGVYIIMITTKEGDESTVEKVMIVR